MNIADHYLQKPPATTFFSDVERAAWAITVLSVFHSYTAAEPLKIKGSRAMVQTPSHAFRSIVTQLSLIADAFFSSLSSLTLPANNCG